MADTSPSNTARASSVAVNGDAGNAPLHPAPTRYRCSQCGYDVNRCEHPTPSSVKVTCLRCGHSALIALAPDARVIAEPQPQPQPPQPKPDVENFRFDGYMIECPPNFYDASGCYRFADSFICSYRTANRLRTRFPANHVNIMRLLEWGISESELRGFPRDKFFTRLLDRLAQLVAVRECFATFERGKLAKGVETIMFGDVPVGTDTLASWVDVHSCPDRSFYYQQRLGVELCLNVGRALVAFEQRTGKTPMMQAVLRELRQRGDIDTVVIVAPVMLLRTAWRDELERYWPDCRSIIMNSDASRVEAIKYDWNVYLTSFESCIQNWRVIRELHDPKRVAVIFDETIKIKNPKAQRAMGALAISSEVEFCYLLSGAPVSRLHEDIWTQAFCIDRGILGDNYDAFSVSFFQRDYNGRQSFKSNMKPIFYELSEHFMARCTRGEAEQFTGRDSYTINVRLKADPVQAQVYREMLTSCLALLMTEDGRELEQEAPNILVQLLRLREICGGFFSFESFPGMYERARLPGNPKLDWLREYFDEHEGEQTVILCEFDEEEDQIAELLDELRVPWGGMLQARHEKAHGDAWGDPHEIVARHIREFQDGDRVVFLGKHSSVGHGVTLNAADACIFYNLGFNSDNYDQGRMRIVKGGKCVLIYHLMVSGSLETEHIYPTLRGRASMKADMFQDVKRTGYYNFFEQLSQAALEVAASTSYDHDPLEREARRITGYDGPLSGDEFNLWLYGSKEPTASILRALDRVRMLGGARSAYAKMSDERNLVLAGIPEEHSERICEIATEFAKATTAVPWHAFISAVCLALDIQPVRKSTSDRFDLMVAYLRMKGSMSASTIANANVLVAPSNQGD